MVAGGNLTPKEISNYNQVVIFGGNTEVGKSIHGKRSFHSRHCKKGKRPAQDNEENIKTIKTTAREDLPKSFNIWETNATFPFSVMKVFGATEVTDPSSLRIHVVFQERLDSPFPKSPKGFSFPLCGFSEVSGQDQVKQAMGIQISCFAQYMGNQQIVEFVEKSWYKARASYINNEDVDGFRHAIITVEGCHITVQEYLYIHNERVSEDQIATKAA